MGFWLAAWDAVDMAANYLTTDEAAAQLRLSNKTVRRMLIDGRLPGTRIGPRWRISAQVVSEILDGRANRDAVQRFCDENRGYCGGYPRKTEGPSGDRGQVLRSIAGRQRADAPEP